MVRLGIVGLGAWALRLISCIENPLQLDGVLTNRIDANSILPTHVKVFRDFDEFVSNDFSHIIISNQASMHQQSLREVRLRMPFVKILIEKPFALNLEEIRANSNEFNDERVLVNHTLLFNKSLIEIKKADPRIPQKIISVDCNRGPDRSDCSSLWDYGPHPISVALYLCDAFDRMMKFEVISAHTLSTPLGNLYHFKIMINDITEIESVVGNGFPIKSRKYEIYFDNHDSPKIFDGLLSVNPQPVQLLLEEFVKSQNDASDDKRWGSEAGLQVTKILEGIQSKLS